MLRPLLQSTRLMHGASRFLSPLRRCVATTVRPTLLSAIRFPGLLRHRLTASSNYGIKAEVDKSGIFTNSQKITRFTVWRQFVRYGKSVIRINNISVGAGYLLQTTVNLQRFLHIHVVAGWLSGNGFAHMNEVTLCRAQLVPGWVTVSGFNSWCGTFYLGMWPATHVNSAWPSLCG